MIITDLEQYDDSVDKKLDVVIKKEEDIIANIAGINSDTSKTLDVQSREYHDSLLRVIELKSVIKSVQFLRGDADYDGITMIINPVNTSKTMILLDSASSSRGSVGSTFVTNGVYIDKISSTSILIRSMIDSPKPPFSAQVIEFY